MIGAAIEANRTLGPRYFDSVYEEALTIFNVSFCLLLLALLASWRFNPGMEYFVLSPHSLMLQPVQWALGLVRQRPYHMRIDHRCLHAGMAKILLQLPYVHPLHQKVRRK